MDTKCCRKCKTEKSILEFSKDSRSTDKLQGNCKKCNSEYHYANRDRIAKNSKERYLKSRDCRLVNMKKYAIDNKADIRAYKRQYHLDNAVNLNAKSREYYTKNKDVLNKKQYERKRRRLKVDPVFKLVNNLRRRTAKAVESCKAIKSNKSIELLGCSLQTLKVYIESRFTAGMTWEKIGREIHIDHIKPCASFDLTDPEQQRQCFHYTNLQPLWAVDNLRKGAKLEIYPYRVLNVRK